jgi:NO-binding membrane sensor protein with MHYT domain
LFDTLFFFFCYLQFANRFLLFAAAASMGGVGIWSMHFIGNNSLTITLDTGDRYQLSYSTGFTFLSLVVAILTMFLAFAFVGITEEARVGRIVPSGVIAGVS